MQAIEYAHCLMLNSRLMDEMKVKPLRIYCSSSHFPFLLALFTIQNIMLRAAEMVS